MTENTLQKKQRKPAWFKIRTPLGQNYSEVKKLVTSLNLHTVCQEANCPNRAECYGERTATFLIMGENCTRGCSFCNVSRGEPSAVDEGEARRVAEAVVKLGLEYAVITSVTRDDLPDGGARVFADVIESIREIKPGCKVEVLIPDFMGNQDALKKVLDARPDVLNHNIETVARLYPEVRRGADYHRSLQVFKRASSYDSRLLIKSGLMVGLGEKLSEISEAMADLYHSGCRLLTVGQYLAPSENHHPVIKFYTPEEFGELEKMAYQIGFMGVVSGPLIRSSYRAHSMFREQS